MATKLSRSFDMKEDGSAIIDDKNVRRHQVNITLLLQSIIRSLIK